MKYVYAIIGFISVFYVGNDFVSNTLQWEFYDKNIEMIKVTIYFMAFIAALFGYNLKTNNQHYGYAVISGIASVWVTTFIKANFFIRAGMEYPGTLTIVQLVVVITVMFFTYNITIKITG